MTYLCLGMEKAAYVGLTTLVLSFREEEEKDIRDPNVRPEGQVNVMGFRGKEAWAGNGGLWVENSVKISDNQKGTSSRLILVESGVIFCFGSSSSTLCPVGD